MRFEVEASSQHCGGFRPPGRLRALLLAMIAGCCGVVVTDAATIVWNATNGVSPTTNWSTAANWSGGTPGGGNDAKFFDNGAAGNAVSNINNVVDVSQTVASLHFGNTNGSHTTFIPGGATLTVSGAGGLLAGTASDNGGAQTVVATVTGSGTLAVNNSSALINVYQGAGSPSSQRATLDLSGLGTFTASVSSLQIGVQGVTRPTGTLLLARTNRLTLSGSSGLLMGQASADGTSSGNSLLLGLTNALFANTISISRGKGGALSRVSFNPAFTNAAPSILIRAANGTGRVPLWEIGNATTSSGGNDSIGACDFSGGAVDALVDALVLGHGQPSNNSSRRGEGALTLASGVINVNTLDVAHQYPGNTSYGVGTVNIRGGTLIVNSLLHLGEGGAANTRATVNVFDGVLRANQLTNGPSANTVVALNNATLILSNAANIVLPNFRLTNSTLHLPVAASTNFIVTALAVGGGSNVIHVTDLPDIVSYPAVFRIVRYTTMGGTLNFQLGSLPASAPAYAGYLSNNAAGGAVDLVLTNGPILAQLKWTGAIDGNWNTATANWADAGGNPAVYSEGAILRFDDTAAGPTAIVFTGARLPGSMTVSNDAVSYAFTGTGSIGGTGGLLKAGAGTLVLANAGNNTFSGPITIAAGTLQIGNGGSGGTIGSGAISNGAALVFNRSTASTVTNSISGPGSVIQNGPGALTLGGLNVFTGPLLLNGGKLVLNGRNLGGGALTSLFGTTLAGKGTNSGPMSIAGTIAPGDTGVAGRFTSGALTLTSGASAHFDVGAFTLATPNEYGLAPFNDLLVVNGNLALNGNAVTVNLLEPPQIGRPYRLIQFTGTRSGALDPNITVTGGSGYTAFFNYSAGEVQLIFSNGPSASIPLTYPEGPGPASVSFGTNGQLVYVHEPNGDRIPDFSNAGYRGGGVAIPSDLPVRQVVSPIGGDNRPHVQAAIDAVEALAPDTNGFRGVVLLQPGTYPMTGTLRVKASGVVVRGSGSGTNGTILQRTDNVSDDLILVQAPATSGRSEVPGTRKNILNAYVPVGATWLTVDNTSGLAVGDTIVIRRPHSEISEWNFIMGMQPSAQGGTGDWQSGDATMVWDRVITEIEGNRIRFDAPITQAIEQQWAAGAYIYKYTWSGRLENVGLEDIRGESIAGEDERGTFVGDLFRFNQVQNGWVRRCQNQLMRGRTLGLDSCKWITVEDVVSYHPPLGSHSGASVQIFTGSSMDQVLFRRISAYSAGFEFSAGDQCPGPVVFSESQVPEGFASSGPHGAWNNGFLWDVLEMDHSIATQLQQKGWNGANHLAWNVETKANINFERPPTVHLWIQGSMSPSASPGAPRSSAVQYGARPPEVLSWNTRLQPASLYRAQLSERVGAQTALAVLGRPDGANHLVLTALPESQNGIAGQTNTFTVQMTVAPDYPGSTVTFSAAGLPAGMSASFSPPTLSTSGVVSVAIVTTPATVSGSHPIKLLGTGTFPKFHGGTHSLAHPVFVTLVVSGTDSDSDGIPDDWTMLHFGHPTGLAGDNSRANDDADGDRMTNRAEYLAGTNPLNAASKLAILSAERLGNDVRVKWLGVGGRSYVLEGASDLSAPGGFVDVSPRIDLVAGAGEVITQFVDPGVLTNLEQRLYRVRLWR